MKFQSVLSTLSACCFSMFLTMSNANASTCTATNQTGGICSVDCPEGQSASCQNVSGNQPPICRCLSAKNVETGSPVSPQFEGIRERGGSAKDAVGGSTVPRSVEAEQARQAAQDAANRDAYAANIRKEAADDEVIVRAGSLVVVTTSEARWSGEGARYSSPFTFSAKAPTGYVYASHVFHLIGDPDRQCGRWAICHSTRKGDSVEASFSTQGRDEGTDKEFVVSGSQIGFIFKGKRTQSAGVLKVRYTREAISAKP